MATRFGLYGIGGLYNYGCEAIVRGTTELLRMVEPEADITLFTSRSESDAAQIGDLGIRVCQVHDRRRGFTAKALGKLAKAAAIPYDDTRSDYGTVLDGCDALVSIGGDIYTIPYYLRNRNRYPYFNRLVKIGDMALQAGKRELIVGASIGPFGAFDKAVGYYSGHLRKVDLILCREQGSVDYLATLGVTNNVEMMADPAFFVRSGTGNCEVLPERRYLGVNLSPLSIFEVHGGVGRDDYSRLAKLLVRLSDSTGLPLMLIPHVISWDDRDNDRLLLEQILECMDESHRATTVLADARGFIDAKRYLRQCRVVIAARMHCGVNAICEGIPAIFLSYSAKSVGMCRFIYGSDSWVASLDNAERLLPGMVERMLSAEDEHRQYLAGRVQDIRNGLTGTASYGLLSEFVRGAS